MPQDEDHVFDAFGTQPNVFLLDCLIHLAKIFDHLFIEPHHQLYGVCALNRCFAIRLLDVHDERILLK